MSVLVGERDTQMVLCVRRQTRIVDGQFLKRNEAILNKALQ
jgi:hypothetical protein